MFIDILVIVIVCTICSVILFNIYVIGGALLSSDTEESVLNKAYFRAVMEQEHLKRLEELGNFFKQQASRKREEQTSAEAAWWQDPIKSVKEGLEVFGEHYSASLLRCVEQIFAPLLREKQEVEEQERLRQELHERNICRDRELQMMRFEEWRQRTAENWWKQQTERRFQAQLEDEGHKSDEQRAQQNLRMAQLAKDLEAENARLRAELEDEDHDSTRQGAPQTELVDQLIQDIEAYIGQQIPDEEAETARRTEIR
eukprot:TRINITY_DN7897_c0_g1_i9.p1 TRINITY_DN7897_c0_g1~~TRINITY_DN7897_c0_g1_i9.p1  ORF type:complete len:269 (+),score=66.42 TRINITY_DN7897_c0_g1_i9:42-809(+)